LTLEDGEMAPDGARLVAPLAFMDSVQKEVAGEALTDEHVSGLARSAMPQVRGYAAGQALDVKWPGDPFDNNQNTGLLLLAAFDPNELGELIIKAIVKEQPLSQLEHGERVKTLTARITELSYVEAALVERNGGEHDPQTLPQCILGVRLEQTEAGEAAA
jgi:hypothetical protein